MPRSSSLEYAQIVPPTPKGTETRKTSRQSSGPSRPPSMSPMKDPDMAATLLIPSARPRWFEGNVSVRIAAEFAMSIAAPRPWTIRMPIR